MATKDQDYRLYPEQQKKAGSVTRTREIMMDSKAWKNIWEANFKLPKGIKISFILYKVKGNPND